MFYTNFDLDKDGNTVLIRGYENGKRFSRKETYKPFLFVSTNEKTSYQTIHNEPVQRIDFQTIRDAKNFIRENKDVYGYNVYGLEKFPYACINDLFPHEVQFDTSLLKIGVLDIETARPPEGGFPDPQIASAEVTLIPLFCGKRKISIGLKDLDEEQYLKVNSEKELLKAFLNLWTRFDLDIVTGWNCELFDIQYLFNRITKILGIEYAKKLSPWEQINKKTVTIKNKKVEVVTLKGIQVLDYKDLYQKFILDKKESYSLDFIAQEELGVGKLSYDEYDSIFEFAEKDPLKFLQYNRIDCERVLQLDLKLNLLDLIIQMGYQAKTNFQDIYATVLPWDIIIHNYLLDKGIVVDPAPHNEEEDVEGGYVQEPIKGLHEWVVSFDLDSLYPSLIIQYNISPETFQGMKRDMPEIEDILEGRFQNETTFSVAANGAMFLKEKRGIFAELMATRFDKRKSIKARMKEVEKEYEKLKDVNLNSLISSLDNAQKAAKLQMNAFYGMLLNAGCRWNKREFGQAITLSGQMTVKWAGKNLDIWLNSLLNSTSRVFTVYIDTDSCYLNLSELVKRKYPNKTKEETVEWLDKFAQSEIQPFLKKTYTELFDMMGCIEFRTNMKRENICDRVIFSAKKKYVLNIWDSEGVRYEKPKLKVVGLQAIRSDTPKVCRDAIKKAMSIILNESESKLQDYVESFKQEYLKMGFEQIGKPTGVSGISEYSLGGKSIPIHVRASLQYNDFITKNNLTDDYQIVYNGDKIKYCYMRDNNPIGSNVIGSPSKLPEIFNQYLDKELQFEKTFFNPVESITKLINWQPKKVADLTAFF
jgi:DNA polymerase elongation subunit (family B)